MENAIFKDFEALEIDSNEVRTYQGGDTGTTNFYKTEMRIMSGGGLRRAVTVLVKYGDWDDRDLCCE